MRSVAKKILWMCLMLFVLLMPIYGREDMVHLMTITGIWIIIAMGLNVLTGYMGYVSFGHAAFTGLGAYGSAILSLRLGMDFWPSMAIAASATAVLGALLGFGILRLTGAYFSIGTLLLGEILYSVYYNWSGVTGGYMGLTSLPTPELFLPGQGIIPFTLIHWFYFVHLVVFLMVVGIREMVSSQFGKELIAIRENESFAESVGVNVKRRKIQCFALSAFLAGLGGAFFAHFLESIGPDSFTVGRSLEFITIIIIGGLGSLVGPILGSYILILLSLYLEVLGAWRMVVYGMIIIVVLFFGRGGIVGMMERIFKLDLRK